MAAGQTLGVEPEVVGGGQAAADVIVGAAVASPVEGQAAGGGGAVQLFFGVDRRTLAELARDAPRGRRWIYASP